MPKLLDRLPFRRKPAAAPTPIAAASDQIARAVQAFARKAPDAVEASLKSLGRPHKGQVAPALLLTAGAGVAFWWWTQWAQGRAETDAAKDKPED